MRTLIFSMAVLGALFCQSIFAVHPLPSVPNTCYYSLATPHRPDPRNPTLDTPEERCQAADTFALSNVPTTPVGVITPSDEPGYYCTLDGSTIADPRTVAFTDPDFANELTGATSCAGDSVCQDLFGENATCEAFANDASGFGTNGWVSQGPAGSITIAGDLAGSVGAHSMYIRSADGNGHIFYFATGVFRTHSLTAPGEGSQQVLDITFCKAENSPVVQRTKDFRCEGFFCRPVVCCGPHFPCDGYPNLPPLLAEDPVDRIASLDLELEALINGDDLHDGQGRGMRQLLVTIADRIDSGALEQACTHIDHFINAIAHNLGNGKLNPDAAGPLEAAAVALRVELGCAVPG